MAIRKRQTQARGLSQNLPTMQDLIQAGIQHFFGKEEGQQQRTQATSQTASQRRSGQVKRGRRRQNASQQ